ncbi:MAG: alpha/beta hydrolase [Chitinophagaceae bacterium]|nr:MAG: alpha/beta hydrolase [Chitinophagaceae bacterium]
MRKMIANTIISVVAVLCCVALLLYFVQERLIFFPQKLPVTHKFVFQNNFSELTVTTRDNKKLHAVLFKADSISKGVIFYLHGNAGSIDSWGELAAFYNKLDYDVMMPDYRGYGKSEGSINSQKQFFDDVQDLYAYLKNYYTEHEIVVLGYSIGTGAAAHTAATNNPGLLILQAPYYTLTDLVKNIYPVVPSFLLKYKFETAEYIKKCTMPIVIFHGDRDEVIYHGSSLKLKDHLKPADTLITLKDQSHNGITENPDYRKNIKRILTERR